MTQSEKKLDQTLLCVIYQGKQNLTRFEKEMRCEKKLDQTLFFCDIPRKAKYDTTKKILDVEYRIDSLKEM